jgi:hypothetical protein
MVGCYAAGRPETRPRSQIAGILVLVSKQDGQAVGIIVVTLVELRIQLVDALAGLEVN